MNRFTVTIHRKDNSLTQEVEKDSFTIGRSLDCDLSINDTHVSRVHVTIGHKGDQIWIEDKNSSNGTYVNGSKIIQGTPVFISSADRIQLGRSEFILVVDLEIFELPEPDPIPFTPSNLKAPVFGKSAKVEEEEDSRTIPIAVVAPVIPATMDKPAEKKSIGVAEPNHDKTMYMPPPSMAPQQAEKILQEAKRQAAQIILEGETQAEKRNQALYQKARDTQAQAEAYYQSRIAEANKEADTIMSDFQHQGQQLIHDARKMAQELRDEVEGYVQSVKEKAKKDVETIISEGTSKVESMKAEAMEMARSVAQKDAESKIRTAEEEAARIVDFAKKQADQIQEQLTADKEELERVMHSLTQHRDDQCDVEKRIEALLSDAEKQKKALNAELADLKKSVQAESEELTRIKYSLEELTSKNKEAEEQLKKTTEKQALLSMEVKDIEGRKEQLVKEHDAQKIALTEKLEKEKNQMAKSEEQRVDEMRLEAAKRLQKMEQNLIEDVMSKKEDLIKEIHVQIEREVVKVMEADQWRKISGDVLNQIQDAIEGRVANMSQSSATKVAPDKLVQKRNLEKIRWAVVGLGLGALLLFGVQVGLDVVRKDGNPLQTLASLEAKKRQEDLERRRFNPPQVADMKATYTDSVIYTKGFSVIYLDQGFQQRLYKATAHYLLKTWRIEEEKSIQVLSAANALVKELQDKREKIHPDFVKDGIEKMRAIEKQSATRMKGILGSEVRLESFRRFEKNFYQQEVDRRSTAQN